MQKICTVVINGEAFPAGRGEVLLDAALANGVDIPHDCRSGHCGTCQLRVLRGLTIGGDSDSAGVVKACQARVISDLELLVEPVPDRVVVKGVVAGLRSLDPYTVELRIRPHEAISYLPGQYFKLQFRGYPARCFSPTVPMTRSYDWKALRFQIRRVPGGRVSCKLGEEIVNGHPVRIEGPFGSAYFRPDLANRLVLVASGTGFAPIWSIATAALAENRARPIVLVAGASEFDALYMWPAFRRLQRLRNVRIIPVAGSAPRDALSTIRRGRPEHFVPEIQPDDIVYACGGPKMVQAVRDLAVAAGAAFYADPFVSQSGEDGQGALSWVLNRFTSFGGRP